MADQLTHQIDGLRRERAKARPLDERLASAARKHELAQQEVTKAAEILQKAQERSAAAARGLAEASTELDELRRQQQEAQHSDHADPIMEHLQDYFEELVDAVEATPEARTARIFAALTALRTILHKGTATGTHPEDHVEGDMELDEEASQDDSGSDHTCASHTTPERSKSAQRTPRHRSTQHYTLGNGSDTDEHLATRRRRAEPRGGNRSSRTTKSCRRSRSPIERPDACPTAP